MAKKKRSLKPKAPVVPNGAPASPAAAKHAVQIAAKKPVKSLLDEMQDGREYESLVNCAPAGLNIVDEFRRALAAISSIRNRPILMYAGNMINATPHPLMVIGVHDELPFAELVDAVAQDEKQIDVVVLTPGGSAQTVSYFVDKLRSRFAHVSYIIPYACMSAGSIWVMSGDEIWMDERSYLGPIDPQVPGKDGRWYPLLAIWVLVKRIQEEGKAAIAAGGSPDWAHLQLLRSLDPKELGDAISASGYSKQMAADYLEKWKLSSWTTHSSTGQPVTPDERKKRAEQIADELCKHDRWKMHSHRLPRDVVVSDLRLKIEKCESLPGLSRAVRRLWALMYFLFENTNIVKMLISDKYALFRQRS